MSEPPDYGKETGGTYDGLEVSRVGFGVAFDEVTGQRMFGMVVKNYDETRELVFSLVPEQMRDVVNMAALTVAEAGQLSGETVVDTLLEMQAVIGELIDFAYDAVETMRRGGKADYLLMPNRLREIGLRFGPFVEGPSDLMSHDKLIRILDRLGADGLGAERYEEQYPRTDRP